MRNKLYFYNADDKLNTNKEFLNEIDFESLNDYYNIKIKNKYLKKINTYRKILIGIIFKEIKFYNKENFSFEELNFFLGHWINRYIYISINRYENLIFLKKKYKNFEFIFKISKTQKKFIDSFDYLDNVNNNNFNNSILSNLSDYLNIPHKNVKVNITQKKKNNWFNIKNKIIYICYLFQIFKKGNLIFNSYLNKKNNNYFIYNFRSIILPSFPYLTLKDNSYNINKRSKIYFKYKRSKSDDILEKFLISNLFMHIPVSFFEGVMIYKNHANNMFNRRKFKKITTANHFDHNDLFKLFCIYQKRGSSTINLIQHGNNYFTNIYSSYSSETTFANYFHTWGKQGSLSNNYFNVRTFNYKPNFKLKRNNNILIIIEDIPHKCFLNNNYLNYLKNIKLISNFRDYLVSKKITFDFKIIDNPKTKNLFNKLNFNKLKKNRDFLDIIDDYDIILFNYYSTGFLECVSINKPCLILTNEHQNTSTVQMNIPLNTNFENYITYFKNNNIYNQNLSSILDLFANSTKKYLNLWKNKKIQTRLKQFSEDYSKFQSSKSLLKLFYE